MKFLLFLSLLLLSLSAGVRGWCEKKYVVYNHYKKQANPEQDRVFPDVESAKKECDGDATCRGVGQDRRGYKKYLNDFGYLYDTTIYLLDESDIKKGPKKFYRYNTFLKADEC